MRAKLRQASGTALAAVSFQACPLFLIGRSDSTGLPGSSVRTRLDGRWALNRRLEVSRIGYGAKAYDHTAGLEDRFNQKPLFSRRGCKIKHKELLALVAVLTPRLVHDRASLICRR